MEKKREEKRREEKRREEKREVKPKRPRDRKKKMWENQLTLAAASVNVPRLFVNGHYSCQQ